MNWTLTRETLNKEEFDRLDQIRYKLRNIEIISPDKRMVTVFACQKDIALILKSRHTNQETNKE